MQNLIMVDPGVVIHMDIAKTSQGTNHKMTTNSVNNADVVSAFPCLINFTQESLLHGICLMQHYLPWTLLF